MMSLPVISTSATSPVIDFLEEVGQRDGLRAPVEVGGEIPDQYPDHDEDHPEEQALEGRVQPWPPNRLAFKNITPCDGSVTRKSSATASPTIHTILSVASTTSGSESRSPRSTFRSTRTSWSFLLRPPMPSGLNRSPGWRDRTASGVVRPRPARPRCPRRPGSRRRRPVRTRSPGSTLVTHPLRPTQAETAQPWSQDDLSWYRQRNPKRVRKRLEGLRGSAIVGRRARSTC